MTTFFTILFIILGINVILMFFSLSGNNPKAKKPSNEVSKTSIPDVHSIDLISSKYKKAI